MCRVKNTYLKKQISFIDSFHRRLHQNKRVGQPGMLKPFPQNKQNIILTGSRKEKSSAE